ncbi:MAG: DNA glycosylase [Thermoflexaceae bacterium]|nr:DNA glycosylase [Thermoflexaceae bacterium]
MKVIEENGNVFLQEVQDFNIGQTLECGQCFHFKKIAEGEYGISAYGRLLRVRQDSENPQSVILMDTTMEEYRNIWEDYFDFKRDYGAIKKALLAKDSELKDAIDTMWGVHILNQDFFETLLSFILSQNKQIPHIKKIVEDISREYGCFLGKIGNEEFYSFPDVNTLKEVTEEDFRKLKAGFRAPYLCDAVKKIYDGRIEKEIFEGMNSEETMKELMKIKGVGEKVASCVMLFSLGKRDAFPVDVWIKRIMEYLYFHEDTDKETIRRKAFGMFGEYGGYAQQYLFYYGKVHNLGK